MFRPFYIKRLIFSSGKYPKTTNTKVDSNLHVLFPLTLVYFLRRLYTRLTALITKGPSDLGALEERFLLL